METPLQLHRAESFLSDFRDWQSGTGKTLAQRKIRELYELFMVGHEGADCSIVQTPTYAMFVLYRQDGWDTDSYRFLMDHWRELILQQGYTSYMSDLRNELLDGGVRRQIERHFLKPDIYDAVKNGQQANRRFGNITLELVLRNSEADLLKLTIGYYHDRKNGREMGMEKLMEYLLRDEFSP